jgi:hypothetical protein
MCEATFRAPALVCTVGDLTPGSFFHGPSGENYIVLALARSADSTGVIDVSSGRITPVYSDIKLGIEGAGGSTPAAP